MVMSKGSGKEDYKERQRRRREERKAEASLTVPDGWAPAPFTEQDNPHGRLFARSEFSVKFPKYREKYLRENWPVVKALLKPLFVSPALDALEGSLSVATTPRTFDPWAIIKARDFARLLARSVPVEQARRVLEDGIYCEIVPIAHPNRERFVRRRNRLIGPDGATLKALELLTDCYVLVSGKTVACLGPYAGVVQVRAIVDDAFKRNVHPFTNIKRMMVVKKLRAMEGMKDKDWTRFLPNTGKKALSRRRRPMKVKRKGEYTPFPPEQTPRKEDLEMAEGVYFLKEAERRKAKAERKAERAKQVSAQRKKERAAAFVAPPEAKKRKVEENEEAALAADLQKIKKLKKKA